MPVLPTLSENISLVIAEALADCAVRTVAAQADRHEVVTCTLDPATLDRVFGRTRTRQKLRR